MAMRKRIAIFMRRYMQQDFKLYKVDIKYIRNLHNMDDKVLSVSPQTGKNNRFLSGLLLFVAFINIVFRFHPLRKNIMA